MVMGPQQWEDTAPQNEGQDMVWQLQILLSHGERGQDPPHAVASRLEKLRRPGGRSLSDNTSAYFVACALLLARI